MKILTPGTDHEDVWNRYVRGGYATWQPGQDCEVHSHQDAAEVFVILSGQCEFTFDGSRQVVSAGSCVYVGPEEKHKLRVVGNEPMSMFLAVFPNHEPTHTFYEADGTPYVRSRPRPDRPDD